MNCGFIRNYIDCGSLIEEYFHNNGIKEGKYKLYDFRGNLLVEVEYINDKKNGNCKIYNPYKFLSMKDKELYFINDEIYPFNIKTDSSNKFEITRFYYKDKNGYYIFKNLQ